MKIIDVKVHLLQKQLKQTMRISRGGFKVRTHALVEVIAENGFSGLGEGIGNPRLVKALIEGGLKQSLIGKDFFAITALKDELLHGSVYFEKSGSYLCAVSAIEMACWDLKGKVLGLPVYELLGGLCKDRLRCYVSDVYWEEDPERVADQAKRIVDQGFSAVKAHLGCVGPKDETRRVEALRRAIGDDIELMIDLNCGYTTTQALQAVEYWKPYKLKWLEEPLHPSCKNAAGFLAEKASMPIAWGENEFQTQDFSTLFASRAASIAMPDVGRVGGILETKAVSVLASSFGVEVSPHNFSSGVLLAATAHVLASETHADFLEFDLSDNAIYFDLLEESPTVDSGFYKVSKCPGLGVKLKSETLEKYAIL